MQGILPPYMQQGTDTDLNVQLSQMIRNQRNQQPTDLWTEAMKACQAKQYQQAIDLYLKLIDELTNKPVTVQTNLEARNDRLQDSKYNVACCYSLMNRVDDAMVYLVQLDESWKHWSLVHQDPDLTNLRASVAFQEWIQQHPISQ